MANEGSQEPWWEPVREFAVHITVGLGIFLLIAGAAVVLNILVGYLDKFEVDGTIVGGLKLAEYTLFGIDLVLLIVYVARVAYRTGLLKNNL